MQFWNKLKRWRQSGAKARKAISSTAETTVRLLEQSVETNKLLKDIRWELQQQRKMMDVVRLAAARETLGEVAAFSAERQLDFVRTLERIRDDRLCFARFGDGEFKLALRPDYRLKFQASSPELAAHLKRVLTLEGYDSSTLLVGFPHLYRDVHWSGVWVDIWPELLPLLRGERTFGNSHVSRPIFFQQHGVAGVELWRTLWEGRHVCVITGEDSRFELLPELFDNVASVRYLRSVPVDAYDDVARLTDEIKQDSDPEHLYLVSLGPAGTVLAAELSKLGVWAVDIGHISDSYVNVFDGGVWPEFQDVRKVKQG